MTTGVGRLPTSRVCTSAFHHGDNTDVNSDAGMGPGVRALRKCTQLQLAIISSTIVNLIGQDRAVAVAVWLQVVCVLSALPAQVAQVKFHTSVVETDERSSAAEVTHAITSALDWSRVDRALARCNLLQTVEIVVNMHKSRVPTGVLEQGEAVMRDAIRERLSPRLRSIVRVTVEW